MTQDFDYVQRYIEYYNELDQLRKEDKEGPGGPHMHMTVLYKDSGEKTEAYQVGALGLSTEFIGLSIKPDGTISSAGKMSGIEWDESLGRLEHMSIIEAKIKKERGEKLDKWEERAAAGGCDCVDCSDNVEVKIDWKSHRRKLMDGDENEPVTEQDKEEARQVQEALEFAVETLGRPKVVDTNLLEMKEDLLAYKRQVEAGNPKVNKSPEALQLADRLLGAESIEEFMSIIKEHDANAKQGVK